MAAIDLRGLADERLRLRPPVDADVPRVTHICQDAEIQRFTRVPSPYREEDARHFVELAGRDLDAGTGVHLVAVDDGDEVLGAIGLSIDRAELSGELGYWVAADARGRGVATRGGRMLCRLALEGMGLRYIGLMAAASNDASNAVAATLGFTLEGTRRLAMIDGPSGDSTAPRCDGNIWGLLPGELR